MTEQSKKKAKMKCEIELSGLENLNRRMLLK